MRKALFALAVGLVLLAVGLVQFTRPGGAGGEPPLHELGVTSQPSAAGTSAQSAPAAAVRVPLGVAESRSEGGRELTVLVVAKATGTPVPGATVAWRGQSARLPPMDRDESFRVSADFELAVTRYGATARTGADGTVRLPWPEESLSFVARSGGGYAQAGFEPLQPSRLLRVELEPDRTLVAKVVGVRGEPRAGVRVCVDAVRAGKPPVRLALGLVGGSDCDGRFVIPHVDVALAQHGVVRGDAASGSLEIVLRPSVLGQPAESVAVDAEHLPGEPVVLVLPPCGSVRVSLLDSEGRPLPRAQEVATGALLGSVDASWPPDAKHANGYFGADSEAVLPAVAVGRHLSIGAAFTAVERQELDGPSADGQELRVALRPAPAAAVLRGRAVDEERHPLAAVALTLDVVAESGTSGASFARTDAEGRFECTFAKSWLPGTLRKAEWLVRDPEGVVTGHVARLPVPWRLEAGVKDLGTVVFTRPPLLVAGTCVDRDGRPLPNALVSLVTAAFAEPVRWDPPPQPLEGITRSLARGTFTFRGNPARDDLRLRATCAGRVPSPLVAFARGAADVKIVLDRAGSMQGRMLHEPGMGPLLQIALLRKGADDARPVRGYVMLDSAGGGKAKPDASRFVCGDLAPGDYRLVFTLLGEPTPLAELRDVAVREGEPCEDPRLSEVDLRGRLRVVKLALTDSNGAPVEAKGGAVFAGTRNAGRAIGFAVKGGRCEVPTLRLPVDLRVCVPGYEPHELPGVDGDREVRLTVQRELVVELSGVAAADLEGVWVLVELKRKGVGARESEYEVRDTTWSWQRERGPEPGGAPRELAGGAANRRIVRIPGAGEYSVQCSLDVARPEAAREQGPSGMQRALEKITPGSFAFDATAATPTLRIVLDADEVRQKARELAR